MSTTPEQPIKLTSFSHGGGCGCKIAPGVLAEILGKSKGFPIPKELMVGIETADDAAVYKLNDEQALIATLDRYERRRQSGGGSRNTETPRFLP